MSSGFMIGRHRSNFEQSTSGERRYFGVYVGQVTANESEDGDYRVKVKIPALHDAQATHWARIATFMAGPDRGFYCLPEVDDEVLVGFVAGDDTQPIVIGSLWNGSDKTVSKHADAGGKNDRRMWRTRGGHEMEFNDNKDGKAFFSVKTKKGHILELSDKDGDLHCNLIDHTGNNKVTISTTDKHVVVQADSGGTIDIQTDGGTINIKCKELNITTDADMNSTIGGDWNTDVTGAANLTTGGDTKIEASGNINENGSKINLNC